MPGDASVPGPRLDALLRELVPLTEESLIQLGAEGGGKIKDMLIAAAGTLKRVSEFVTGTDDDDDEESWNVSTNAVRQTLLNEQGVLACIIESIKKGFIKLYSDRIRLNWDLTVGFIQNIQWTIFTLFPFVKIA